MSANKIDKPLLWTYRKVLLLYQSNFWTATGALLVPQMLAITYFVLVMSLVEGITIENLTPFFSGGLLFSTILWLLVITYLAIRVQTGLFIVCRKYLTSKKKFSLGDIFEAGSHKRMKAYFLTSALSGLLIMLGLIALIIPGVILTLRWIVAIPISVIEDVGPRQALKKSRELTSGNYNYIAGLVFIFTLITLMAYLPYIGWAIIFVTLPLQAFGWIALYEYLQVKRKENKLNYLQVH